jgi:hypothetical protein
VRMTLSTNQPQKKIAPHSVPVAIYVPPPVLWRARHTPTSTIGVDFIDKSNTISHLRRRRLRLRTAKAKKDGTRAVCGIARLDAR